MSEKIDVYPVGLMRDLHCLINGLRAREPFAIGVFCRRIAAPALYARHGNWRAAKSYFNGYLAEPAPWPEDGPRRCGSGWTKRRALRDWQRRAGHEHVYGPLRCLISLALLPFILIGRALRRGRR